RVDVPEELAARLAADVAGGDGDRADSLRVAGPGHVDRVLEKDDGVVVREGDATASERARGARDGGRLGALGQDVDLARVADVPVLAEVAGQVAARGAERQHGRAGQEVIERLLLDGIDAEAARAPPRGEHDGVVLASAHEAKSPLTLVQSAGAGTHVALDP